MTERPRFTTKDVAEIFIGASIMAFPVATTEEVWTISTELSLMRTVFFVVGSLLALSLVIVGLHHREDLLRDWSIFLQRVAVTYGLTLCLVGLLLYGLGRLDLTDDTWVGVRRIVLVAFPASFAATAVDGRR